MIKHGIEITEKKDWSVLNETEICIIRQRRTIKRKKLAIFSIGLRNDSRASKALRTSEGLRVVDRYVI